MTRNANRFSVPKMANAAGQHPTASIQALIALKDQEKAFFAALPHKELLQ